MKYVLFLIYGILLITLPARYSHAIMRNHQVPNMYFIQDLSGSPSPSFKTVIGIRGKDAFLIIRKPLHVSDRYEFEYTGVGLYKMDADDDLINKFNALCRTLNSVVPKHSDQPGSRNILRFNFDLNGTTHNGSYDYSGGKDFNEKLRYFSEIRTRLIGEGSQEIGFRPDFNYQIDSDFAEITLRIVNTGKLAILMDGPATWGSAERGNVSFVSINISDPEFGDQSFMLDKSHLKQNSNNNSEIISLASRESSVLVFKFPIYSQPSHRKSGPRLANGRLQIEVNSPEDFRGYVKTGILFSDY